MDSAKELHTCTSVQFDSSPHTVTLQANTLQPANRAVEHGRLNGGRTVVGISALFINGSYTSRGTSSSNLEMISSALLPSASAWKLRIMRWRNTSGASAATSSQETLNRPSHAARARAPRMRNWLARGLAPQRIQRRM